MTLSGSADKIRALMSLDPTQKLDISHLFREKALFEGNLPLASMTRIVDMLESDSGEVVYQIQFITSDADRQQLNIRIRADLLLLCQRCLKPVALTIERNSSLVVVAQAIDLNKIDGDFEPLVLEEVEELTVHKLIQDELLLAIPVAPTHDASKCEASARLKDINEAGKIKPFAVLEKLKNKLK